MRIYIFLFVAMVIIGFVDNFIAFPEDKLKVKEILFIAFIPTVIVGSILNIALYVYSEFKSF